MKFYIVIDDLDQESIIEGIDDKAKSSGFHSKGYWFNPWEKNCTIQEGEGEKTEFYIDKEKFIDQLIIRFNGKPINFIFTDFKLEDNRVDGMDLARLIKKRWKRNIPVVMYSSDHDLIVSKLEKDWEENEFENFGKKYDEITSFFKEYPDDTLNRGDYKNILFEYIKKEKYDLDSILINALQEYPDEIFKNIYPRFGGRRLGEVASIISKFDHVSDEFRIELIERAISHFIHLDE